MGQNELRSQKRPRQVKREEWINKPVAAFDTEDPENTDVARTEDQEWSTAEEIAGKLRDKQMNQLLAALKAVVSGWEGPLREGEIERARDYATELAIHLKRE